MKTRFYQIGQISVYPIDESGALLWHEKSFGIKGKQKIKKGQFVKISKIGNTPALDLMNDLTENRAKVVSMRDGYPHKLQLPNGKIIEVFGLILELLPLLERIWLAIKGIFKNDQ